MKISLVVYQRYEPNCGKVPCMAVLRNTWKIYGYKYISTGLPKFNQIFLVHRYICGKVFMKIRSVVFKWSCWYKTNRQA